MIRAAYYYPATKSRPATFKIDQIEDGRRTEVHYTVVAGKTEARRLASTFNAQPWNFYNMIAFAPIKLETVVVLRDGKVIGTIKRYRAHKTCLVSVPGLLSPSANKGRCAFRNIAAAKTALLRIEADRLQDICLGVSA